jgi:hypothetical protein
MVFVDGINGSYLSFDGSLLGGVIFLVIFLGF